MRQARLVFGFLLINIICFGYLMPSGQGVQKFPISHKLGENVFTGSLPQVSQECNGWNIFLLYVERIYEKGMSLDSEQLQSFFLGAWQDPVTNDIIRPKKKGQELYIVHIAAWPVVKDAPALKTSRIGLKDRTGQWHPAGMELIAGTLHRYAFPIAVPFGFTPSEFIFDKFSFDCNLRRTTIIEPALVMKGYRKIEHRWEAGLEVKVGKCAQCGEGQEGWRSECKKCGLRFRNTYFEYTKTLYDIFTKDLVKILNISKTGEESGAQEAALSRIDNPSLLAEAVRSNAKSKLLEVGVIEAILKIEDQPFLFELAKDTEIAKISDSIGIAAIKRIHDSDFLCQLAKNGPNWPIRAAAASNVSNLEHLTEIALSGDKSRAVPFEALDRISDGAILERIAATAEFSDISERARERAKVALMPRSKLIDFLHNAPAADTIYMDKNGVYSFGASLVDADLLPDLAVNSPNASIRARAAEKLEDQEALELIAKKDSRPEIQSIAIKKIKDPKVLMEIAQNDNEVNFLRTAAIRKIEDLPSLIFIIYSLNKKILREIAIEKFEELEAGQFPLAPDPYRIH